MIHAKAWLDVGNGRVEIGPGASVGPFAVLGREPARTAAQRRPAGAPTRRVAIGARCSVGAHAVVFFDVEVGEDSLIGEHAVVREGCRIGARCVVGCHVELNYGVVLGDDVRVMSRTHLTGGVRVGDGSFLGVGVVTSNDRRVDPADYRWRPDEIAPPVIGRGVMVGSGANLLAGVTIGDGAVVGAGALVVKDVPPGAVVLGPVAQVAR